MAIDRPASRSGGGVDEHKQYIIASAASRIMAWSRGVRLSACCGYTYIHRDCENVKFVYQGYPDG